MLFVFLVVKRMDILKTKNQTKHTQCIPLGAGSGGGEMYADHTSTFYDREAVSVETPSLVHNKIVCVLYKDYYEWESTQPNLGPWPGPHGTYLSGYWNSSPELCRLRSTLPEKLKHTQQTVKY